LTLKSQEQKVGRLFDRLAHPIADLVDQQMLQRDVIEAVRRSDLGRMHFVLRAILIQLWSQQAEFDPAGIPPPLIEQKTGSAAARGDHALSAERML
jgi:hypothetical protein